MRPRSWVWLLYQSVSFLKREREKKKKKDSVPSTYNYSQPGCKFTSLVKRGTREGMLLLLLSRFSGVRLCVTPETAAHQAPLSLGFFRKEHWSGLPFPSPMHESEKWKVKLLSCVQLFVTPWTAAHQAPPSIWFSRQEYWSGVPSSSPREGIGGAIRHPRAHVSTCLNESSFFLVFKSHKVHINIGELCCKTTIMPITHWKHFQKKSATHAYMWEHFKDLRGKTSNTDDDYYMVWRFMYTGWCIKWVITKSRT